MNSIHRLVGMGSDRLVVELLGHESPGAVAARPRRYEELIAEARPFPVAADLLRLCHRNGLSVVIATPATSEELDALLRKLEADDATDAQTTADDIDETKPGPEVFLMAIEAGGLIPGRAIAVGDSVWDVKAARAAGIACIAVESGGYNEHELSEEGALHVYRSNCSISSTPARWHCSYKGLHVPLDCAPRPPRRGTTPWPHRSHRPPPIYKTGPSTTTAAPSARTSK